MLFIALMMVLANDNSTKCQEMVAKLLKNLVRRLDEMQQQVILLHVHLWVSQKENEVLMKVSCQVYGIVLDTLGQDAVPFISSILHNLDRCLKVGAKNLTDGEQDIDVMDINKSWHIPYQALIVSHKVFTISPDSLKKYNSIS